jgi:molybdopterin/thiamine biosynthesis adenylyltransferase
MKFITGTHVPFGFPLLHQSLGVAFLDILHRTQIGESKAEEGSYTLNETALARVKNAPVLVVGAGATGCELLKNLAQLGVGTGSNGLLQVADNDFVSTSNLSRQFLYNVSHVEAGKAEAACAELREMCPGINCKAETVRLGTFNPFRPIWGSQLPTALISCVDSFAARDQLEAISNAFNVPLFDCGASGLEGQVIAAFPGLTTDLARFLPRAPQARITCGSKIIMYLPEHAIQQSVYLLDTDRAIARDVFDLVFQHDVRSWLISGKHEWVEPYKPKLLALDDPLVMCYRQQLEQASGQLEEGSRAFDKDKLPHLLFVHAASCLYALSYGLPLPTRMDIRRVAGAMEPAVITTCAIVSGLLAISVLRHLLAEPNTPPQPGPNYTLDSSVLIPLQWGKEPCPYIFQFQLTHTTSWIEICEAWGVDTRQFAEVRVAVRNLYSLDDTLTREIECVYALLKPHLEGKTNCCWIDLNCGVRFGILWLPKLEQVLLQLSS